MVVQVVGREKVGLALDSELGDWEDLVEEELHEGGEVTAVSGEGEAVVLDLDSEGRVEKVGMGHVGDVGFSIDKLGSRSIPDGDASDECSDQDNE